MSVLQGMSLCKGVCSLEVRYVIDLTGPSSEGVPAETLGSGKGEQGRSP